MKTCIVIPAHSASYRLPGKLLLEVNGMTVLEHTYRAACRSSADWVVIACGDEDTWNVAKKIEDDVNAEYASTARVAFMTDPTHTCGTDRVAQMATFEEMRDFDLFINLQADEPMMPATHIDELICQAKDDMQHQSWDNYMATLAVPLIGTAALACLCNRSETKVVFDNNRWAMYFSRSPIPWTVLKDLVCYHHLGIYAYDRRRLKIWPDYHPGRLCTLESLEQLRCMECGEFGAVKVHLVDGDVRGINNQDDFENFRTRLLAG
jgi:3-deoxy-manno-octulosonate cytidylyltransferase (CMP-KDO synthetase)